jgi:hypothetical protein
LNVSLNEYHHQLLYDSHDIFFLLFIDCFEQHIMAIDLPICEKIACYYVDIIEEND